MVSASQPYMLRIMKKCWSMGCHQNMFSLHTFQGKSGCQQTTRIKLRTQELTFSYINSNVSTESNKLVLHGRPCHKMGVCKSVSMCGHALSISVSVRECMTFLCRYTQIHTHTHIHTSVMHVYVYVCVYLYLYVYVYMAHQTYKFLRSQHFLAEDWWLTW
jgi:hypothetical protein